MHLFALQAEAKVPGENLWNHNDTESQPIQMQHLLADSQQCLFY